MAVLAARRQVGFARHYSEAMRLTAAQIGRRRSPALARPATLAAPLVAIVFAGPASSASPAVTAALRQTRIDGIRDATRFPNADLEEAPPEARIGEGLHRTARVSRTVRAPPSPESAARRARAARRTPDAVVARSRAARPAAAG